MKNFDKVTGTIYIYKKHGEGVYVGQTRNTLHARDLQHLNGKSKFDVDYKLNRKSYGPGPEILISKMWTYNSKNLEQTFEKCHKWVDEQEKHYIKKYGTYDYGFNQTKGGQYGLSDARSKAFLKQRDETWEKVHMPGLRKMKKYVEEGRLWATPFKYEENGWSIGQFLSDVRRGQTTVPPRFEAELLSLGFDKNKSYNDSLWQIDYLPALRECSYGKMCHIGAIPAIFEYRGLKIGNLMAHIKAGRTSIPKVYLCEMVKLGSKKSSYDLRFLTKYLPLLKRLKDLRYVPYMSVDKQSNFNIGHIVYLLKAGKIHIPEDHVETMRLLKFETNENRKRARPVVGSDNVLPKKK
jgi:hypothetical protein